MSLYHENAKRAVYRNADPSLTEQSLAKETDINVIIGRFAVSGMVPSAPKPMLSGDFSEIPTDLRGLINMGNSMRRLRASLPEQLRDMALDELLALTPDKLREILTPKPPATEPPAA